ncbi:MAG: hypothetical protein HC804_00110 [Anaerolineae bacterium]|nr:hypothetical protein [Anaerolineae bacterium]
MSKKNGDGPRVQRREKWIELPGDYAGFQFKVWVNAPTKLWTMIGKLATDEAENSSEGMEGLKQIILEHNGWRDFDDNPYPPASETAFWEEIPTELAGCIIIATQTEMGKLPNSLAPKKRR